MEVYAFENRGSELSPAPLMYQRLLNIRCADSEDTNSALPEWLTSCRLKTHWLLFDDFLEWGLTQGGNEPCFFFTWRLLHSSSNLERFSYISLYRAKFCAWVSEMFESSWNIPAQTSHPVNESLFQIGSISGLVPQFELFFPFKWGCRHSGRLNCTIPLTLTHSCCSRT